MNLRSHKVLLVFSLFLAMVIAFSGINANVVDAQSRATKISVSNAANLRQMVRLGRGLINDAVFSPDDSKIALASSIGVWVYDSSDIATPTEPTYFPTPAGIGRIAYSPDGKVIAVTSTTFLYLLDSTSGTEVGKFELKFGALALAYSPDGSLIAVGGARRLTVLETKSLNPVVLTDKISGNIRGLRFSPDGKRLLFGSGDRKLREIEALTGKETRVLDVRSSELYVLLLTKDGKILITAGQDREAQVWDYEEGRATSVIQMSSSPVIDGLFPNGDETRVALVTSTGKIEFFGLDGTFKTNELEPKIGTLRGIAASDKSGRTFVYGSRAVGILYDAATNAELGRTVGHMPAMGSIEFSPDGKTLSIANDNRELLLWDVERGGEIHTAITLTEMISGITNRTTLAYAPDGSYLAMIDGIAARLVNPQTGKLLQRYTGNGVSTSLTLSPDGKLIAWASSQGGHVADTGSSRVLIQLKDHTAWVQQMVFNPAQTILATVGDDGTVRLYSVN